jgi:hypothetical protein
VNDREDAARLECLRENVGHFDAAARQRSERGDGGVEVTVKLVADRS